MAGGCMSSKYKKWLINIVIVLIVTVVMLMLAEFAFRWIDGYRMSTIELKQDATKIEQSE